MIDVDGLIELLDEKSSGIDRIENEAITALRLLRNEVKAWRSGHTVNSEGQWINMCCGRGGRAIDIATTSATDASLKL